MKYLVAIVLVLVLVAIAIYAYTGDWGVLQGENLAYFLAGFSNIYIVNYAISVKKDKLYPFQDYKRFAIFALTPSNILLKECTYFLLSTTSITIIGSACLFLSLFTDAPIATIVYCSVFHYMFTISLVLLVRYALRSTDWNYFMAVVYMMFMLNMVTLYIGSWSMGDLTLAFYHPLNTLFFLPILLDSHQIEFYHYLVPAFMVFALYISTYVPIKKSSLI